jgi:hypothetical protein
MLRHAKARRHKPHSPSVVIATLGRHADIDAMLAAASIDTAAIHNGWEQFIIKAVDHRLFIVGSDSRGTAYGLLALSQAIGVSPWYWWADLPVPHSSTLYVNADYTSRQPTVKYRGIFINDEDWGLQPWAAKNYERQLGDIGPRTYARVCELLLRLKANMLAPAMHSCTGAFYSHPESKLVADSFGIVITTSHCEPLLLNNAAKSEWDEQRDGDWNYKTNRETILRKWDHRLSEASRFENIYTTAMRGVHDAGLRGNLPMDERVPLISTVISDQRRLLEKHTGRKATEIPQIFVPYKETMAIYEAGLRVPDDITLVWVDDNYGYMKRLSTPAEQQRSGRAGVYYHLSYLGAPHDYLWLNTTPPALMYEELKKAYDHGADRYWLLNVGDIKPMELGIQTFIDMAWNIHDFNFQDVNTHQASFLARALSSPLQPRPHASHAALEQTLTHVLNTYYRLAWSRKPEFMGFEYEWDDEAHTGLHPTEFSFTHYGEAQQRLADYQLISDQAEALPPQLFQLVQYPVQAAYQMNRKFLMAQLNHELLAHGHAAEANWAARQARQAYDSINALNRRYNDFHQGKWQHFMDTPPGYCALYHLMPDVQYTPAAGETPVDLSPLSTLLPGLLAPSASAPPAVAARCLTLNLAAYTAKTADAQLVSGLGYDWQAMQLGRVTYTLPPVDADTLDVVFYTLPFWPLHAGTGNRVSVSVDRSAPQVFHNQFREYDRSWKDQVMRNGIACRFRFPILRQLTSHTLTFSAIDPGQMLQRVIIDWGGLQPSYLGPQPQQKTTD